MSHLGRLVVENLLADGVPAAQIVAAVRTPQKGAGLVARGVQVREADYERPQTLAYAAAAVAVLTGQGHQGRAYELGGDPPGRTPTWQLRSPRAPGRQWYTGTSPSASTSRHWPTPDCPSTMPSW